jgi:hypothetical protein
MSEPLSRILSLDFDGNQKVWVVKLLRADGKRYVTKLRPDAFEFVRQHPMGQVMLHMWFTKANPLPEEQMTPKTA